MHSYLFWDPNEDAKRRVFELLADAVFSGAAEGDFVLLASRSSGRPVEVRGDRETVQRGLAPLVDQPEFVATLLLESPTLKLVFTSHIESDGLGYGVQSISAHAKSAGDELAELIFDLLCSLARVSDAWEGASWLGPSDGVWWPTVFHLDWPEDRMPMIPYYGWAVVLPFPMSAIALEAGISSAVNPFEIRELGDPMSVDGGMVVRLTESPYEIGAEQLRAWREFLIDTFDLTPLDVPRADGYPNLLPEDGGTKG